MVGLAVAATACTTAAENPSTTTAGAPVTTTTMPEPATTATVGPRRATGEYVRVMVGQISAVSPDGSSLLTTDGEVICVQGVEAGGDCVVWRSEGGRANLETSWSPDSSTVVFFDRIEVATRFEGPVWRLDTAGLEVDQLLDNEGPIPLAVAISGEDVAVAGSSDGDEPLAVRLVTPTGDTDLLAAVSAQQLEWLPDGSGVIFSGFTEDWQGLWRIDAGDGTVEPVRALDELGAVWLSALSPDGSHALVYYRQLVASELFPADVSHFGLLDLDSGEESPLIHDREDDFVGPIMAAFSPDGTSITYLYHAGADLEAPLALVIRPVDGGDERLITADLFGDVGQPPSPAGLGVDPRLVPVWRSDNRLVLPTYDWVLVVDVS